MQRIILATGRCGSTLLSRCMGDHPQTAMLSEFIAGLDHAARFRHGPVSGADLAAIVGSDHAMENLWISRGFTIEEMPHEVPRQETMTPFWRVPRLSLGVMSTLSTDPQGLLLDMLAWCRAQPTRPLSEHYDNLFTWLAASTGKSYWIERSAFSTDHLGELLRLFPQAKIVHIHRDGRETAMSMRHHVHFKLAVSLQEQSPDEDELAAMVACASVPDPVIDRVNNQPDVAAFGRFWADSIVRLYRDLPLLPAYRFMDLRFEDLVADPVAALQRVGTFFELPNIEPWAREAAAMVSRSPRSYLTGLSASEAAALEQACRPGQLLLGRVEVDRVPPLLKIERRLDAVYDAEPSLVAENEAIAE